MFEYVVRPFQAPNAQGLTVIPSTPQTTTQQAVLTWGATGTLPPPQYVGVTMQCCDDTSTELSRKAELVQIFNPEDSSQYIWVERAIQIKANKIHKTTCSDDTSQTDGVDLAGIYGIYYPSGVNNFEEHCHQIVNLKNINTTAAA